MKRLFEFIRPVCHSHLIGILIGFAAFQTTVDLAAVKAIIPTQLGFRWPAELLAGTPVLCVLGCLVVFIVSPVGNSSQHKLVRRIGAIPVLGRYCLFVGILYCVMLLELLFLNLCTSSSIQSLKLSGDVSPLSSVPDQIQKDAGGGVTFQWRGDETRIFFLKEKRAAVLRAIQKEHVKVEE